MHSSSSGEGTPHPTLKQQIVSDGTNIPMLAGRVQEAISAALPPMTQNPMTNLSPALVSSDVSAFVSSIVSALVPIIVDTVQDTIKRVMGVGQAEMGHMRRELIKQAWKNDANEQYSRRENIRITGIEKPVQRNNEDAHSTNQIVIDTCQKMGVTISEKDISTSHWLPGRKPTIIAKFVRRDTKAEIMRKKKNLSKKDPSIIDDLTKARILLLEEIKKDRRIKRAFVRDGIIRCAFDEREDGEVRRISIRGPSDLLLIGWGNDDIDWTYTLFE